MAPSPNQLANLRPPWKPGESGNPSGTNAGRPPGPVSLTKLIKEALQGTRLCNTETPDGRTNGEWLVDRMIVLAMEGNASYMKEIMDRNDGPVPKAEEKSATDLEAVRDELDRLSEHEDANLDPAGPASQGLPE